MRFLLVFLFIFTIQLTFSQYRAEGQLGGSHVLGGAFVFGKEILHSSNGNSFVMPYIGAGAMYDFWNMVAPSWTFGINYHRKSFFAGLSSSITEGEDVFVLGRGNYGSFNFLNYFKLGYEKNLKQYWYLSFSGGIVMGNEISRVGVTYSWGYLPMAGISIGKKFHIVKPE